MVIGIFSRTFSHDTLPGVLQAIVDHSIRSVHFNLKSAGLDSLPSDLGESACREISDAFQRHQLEMIGISGTYNVIHPDITKRDEETWRCCQLIAHCKTLGTSFVSLCTGTRDPNNMWQHHPENTSPEACRELRQTLEKLLAEAENQGVILGIEPEPANVIDTSQKARKLLDDIRSPNLKIILDGFNLVAEVAPEDRRDTLWRAFDQLGPEIAMVHAKNIATDLESPVDWNLYFQWVNQLGYDGPVVLHNIPEDRVGKAIDSVNSHLN